MDRDKSETSDGIIDQREGKNVGPSLAFSEEVVYQRIPSSPPMALGAFNQSLKKWEYFDGWAGNGIFGRGAPWNVGLWKKKFGRRRQSNYLIGGVGVGVGGAGGGGGRKGETRRDDHRNSPFDFEFRPQK